MEFERRQHERQKLYSPEYFDIGAENGGVIVDLSEDGLGFQAAVRIEKGREVTFSFSLGTGYRIAARGRIAWVGPSGKSGGTTFTLLPADSRSIIREWLAKTAESATFHEAAPAVESQTGARESESEVPLIIERIESPRVPMPARPAPMEPASEALAAAEPDVESVIPLVAQPVIEAVVQPLVAPDVPPDVQPVVPSVVQSAEEALPETPQEVREESLASPGTELSHAIPHAIAHELSDASPPELFSDVPPEISARDTENKPEAVKTPVKETPHAEVPRPSFPPRNTGELFSRSPWISGQSLPEEKRSRKGLIAVIVIGLLVAAAIASVPYSRAHRQQIGAAVISMGRNIAGQPAPNASGQSQEPPQQSSQQTSQPAPKTSAPTSSTPSASGAAIPGNPPSAVTKPSEIPQPSASTVAPAPSASQTPAPQLHPNAPPAKSGAVAGQSLSAVTPVTAPVPDTGQTEFKRAQQYLNGTGGVAADPVEAAEWLWRSLEKGNTGAAIPLADLYLQGKGVSRSCLQARILLTAASHKGNAEAVQKLSQLPENCEQ